MNDLLLCFLSGVTVGVAVPILMAPIIFYMRYRYWLNKAAIRIATGR